MSATAAASVSVEVHHVSTSRDMNCTLTSLASSFFAIGNASSSADTVDVIIDEAQQFQSILGIGSSLESSTCFNLMQMTNEDRQMTIARLFDPVDGIGLNLMRLTVATSDFCPLPYYSYDDAPEGGPPDLSLSGFSIERDEEFILPVLRDTLQYANTGSVNNLRYFASSWSPPGWMKTSGRLEGGEYNPDYLEHYAKYLLKFIEAYEAEGIKISALTVQNEPLQNEDTYPTAYLPADLEIELIGKHLGPMLTNHNISTDIWCFDHNWNTPYYPSTVFDDPLAASYVTGSAFHGYGGKPSAMTSLKESYPDKDMFFSEGSEFGMRGASELVDIFRNWARSYNAWVTILDSDLQPNAGPFKPSPTMIVLDVETKSPTFRFEYYMYGQFSKFICRGAIRVLSESTDDNKPQLNHVAFINPVNEACGANSGSRVVVAVNSDTVPASVRLIWNGMTADVEIGGESVSTFMWNG